MFFLNFIPDSYLLLAINGTLLAGVVFFLIGVFIRFVKFLSPYEPIFSLVATALLTIGMYCRGGYGVEEEWRARAAELKQKIAIAEAKSHETNVRIETQVVEKIKIIKERVNDNKLSIQQQKDVINSECVIPDVARVLYNRAVDNEISGGTTQFNASTTTTNSAKSKR